MELTDYGRPQSTVPSFKYLGSIMSASDDEWLVVVYNLIKVRKKFVRLLQVMGR